MKQQLRILFAGTADFSAEFLTSLIKSQHQVIGAVTQMDKVQGRGKKIQMTKVKEVALAHNIPVYQFETSLRNPENYTQLTRLDYDLMVVVAFGDILPIELLNYPQYHSINVHPSLLPWGRGASPVQQTIANGDTQTAFCIIKMDATLDTGDILYWEDVKVAPRETSESLFVKLAELGGPILTKVCDNIEYYLANAQPQKTLNVENPKKAYTRKIKKNMGCIKRSHNAVSLDRKLRAYTPWPGLFFAHPDVQAQDIKVINAQGINLVDFASLSLSNLQSTSEFTNFLTNYNHTLAELSAQALAEWETFVGSIVATSKNQVFLACAQGTLLAIDSIQLPGKKATDIASIMNGYPNLLSLGRFIIPPTPSKISYT